MSSKFYNKFILGIMNVDIYYFSLLCACFAGVLQITI
jgi:hypothetical protein